MTPVLEVRGLVRGYGRREVLRGVDLTVEKGQLVGITGENGTGKTTLLRVLAGLLRPQGGTVRLGGRLGFCPQEPAVFEHLTVAENFRWFATAYGLGEWEPRMHELLDRYAFDAWADELVGRVSGGTRQKLNLALALLATPEILLLDEPYAGFDWETYLRFWEHAEALREGGTALVVVAHLIHERHRFDALWSLTGGVLE